MTLRTDDLQTTGCSRFLVQFDIGTTTCHIGRDGDGTCHTGLCNDLSFQLMELRIQYLMCDSSLRSMLLSSSEVSIVIVPTSTG